jgi:hypothetical protein
MSIEDATTQPLTDLDEWERFKADARERARWATFEGSIEQMERACLKIPDAWPNRANPNTPPSKLSRAWYAEEILFAIKSARRLLAAGQAEYAAGEAVLIGALAAESGARHDWPEMRKWREQQDARRRGGLASKHLRGLQAVVDRLVTEHPKVTAQELWNLIPKSEPDDAPIGGFTLYRDGSKIVQVVEDEKGRREKAISFRSFGRYVTRARRK